MTNNVMLRSLGRAVVAGVVGLVAIGQVHPAYAQNRSFNLSSPGARANAMGRAFIGVADDATATVTNPAGLMLLTRPQAYIEFKTSNETFDDGFGFTNSSPGGVSFFGVSSPLGSQFAAAFSYHQYYGNDFGFEDDDDPLEDRGRGYAGSIAMSPFEQLHVGISVGSYSMSSSDDFVEDVLGLEATVGVALGVLFRANDMVTVGTSGFFAGDSEVIPSRFGGGVGIRPTPRILIASDVLWVEYEKAAFPSDNATTFSLGGEYQLGVWGSNQLLARAGFFTSNGEDLNEFDDPDVSVDGNTVGTFGAGFVAGRRLQVDFAFLTHGEAVFSAGVRF